MKLRSLSEAQINGALKVTGLMPDGSAIIGGVVVSAQQCSQIARHLGWEHFEMSGAEIIDKTDKFISKIGKHIKDDHIIGNTEVTFINRRKSDTIKYFDRIKMICPGRFDITILYGIGGKRKYEIYSSLNGFAVPVKYCSTAKELGEWINTIGW